MERASGCPPRCPGWGEEDDCSGQVTWKGRVKRTGLKVTSDDPLGEIYLRQCLCGRHGIFRVYTWYALPYKHYVPDTVDAALEGHVQGKTVTAFCSVHGIHEPSTPLRWIRQFVNGLQDVVEVAERMLRRRFPELGPLVQSDPTLWKPPRWTSQTVWDHLDRLLSACVHCGTDLPSRSSLALSA